MPLSPAEIRERFAANSGVVPLLLLTISHPDLGTPGRLALNNEDVWSRGDQFFASWFDIALPLDSGHELASVQLAVDNVDQAIVATVRGLASPPQITLEVVTSATPDTVEQGPFQFSAKSAHYDVLQVTMTLGYEEILNQAFPGRTYNPRDFPGLFA
ncbi:MAG: DUF1833 domain-containing protein [Salinisphaera sp.]|nr:DUF1833 domain-containing protein [Salinisphaera sp.]